MEYILWGTAMLLASILLIWLGIRHRRTLQANYEDGVQRYTASTLMTIVHLDSTTMETWEDREDGSRELVTQTLILPTYEYTVDGKTYQYHSGQSTPNTRKIGRQITGYYDPANPESITENKPRKPHLGGFGYFLAAAMLLFLAINTFIGNVTIS